MLLTTIAEGPRSEDNCVRYQCECGAVTDWINPGPAVEHDCQTGAVRQVSESAKRKESCCESLLNAAMANLRAAEAKASGDTLKAGIRQQIDSIPRLRRLAVAEAIA